MPRRQSAPVPALARVDPAPPPATGLPEATRTPIGLVPRHEISATTRLWELHPSEPPPATALRLSTCQAPARRGAYIAALLCTPSPQVMPRPAKRNTHHGDTEKRRKAFSQAHWRVAVAP